MLSTELLVLLRSAMGVIIDDLLQSYDMATVNEEFVADGQ